MNYLKKNFPVFLLSGSLIFAGISFSPSAQGAKRITISYVSVSEYGCGSGRIVGQGYFLERFGNLVKCTLTISG